MDRRPATYAALGPALLAALTVGCAPTASHATRAPSAHDSMPVGAHADFTVVAHCGVQFTTIDGETWRTKLRDDGQGNPPDGWPQEITGTLRRPSEDRAVFTSAAIPVTLVFRPAPHARYACS